MSKLDPEKLKNAKRYDKIAFSDERMKREIPIIANYLQGKSILEIACSSGKHAVGLEAHGFTSFGFDVSPEMIHIADEYRNQRNSNAKFLIADATANELPELIKSGFNYSEGFDNVIMLGNAIANLGNYENCIRLLRNVHKMLAKDGIFFMQTVHRPSKPYYNPLRKINEQIVQRIMVPIENEQHNTELHVNIIDIEKNDYESRNSANHFYMFTYQELKSELEKIGFNVLHAFGGYDESSVVEEDGATIVWVLSKN